MLSLQRALSGRYWLRHRARAVLVAASIALGVATCLATGAVERTLAAACRRATAPLAGQADLLVSNGDPGVSLDLAGAIADVPGVARVRPLVLRRVVLPEVGRRPALLLGIDVDPDGASQDDVQVNLTGRSEGMLNGFMLGYKPALLGRDLDAALPDDPHVTVTIAGRSVRLLRAGTVRGRGHFAPLSGDVLVLSVGDAASLFGRRDRVTRFDVTLARGADRDEVARRLGETLGDRATVAAPENHDLRVREMTGGLKAAFSLCGAGALVVALFLVANVLSVSVAERAHEVGVLRAVGATRAQVAGLFLGEAALLGVAGALPGLAAGVALGKLLLGPMSDVFGDLFLPLPDEPLQTPVSLLVLTGAAGVVTALAAGLAPALRAARQQPTDALRRVPPPDGGLPLRRGGVAVVLASVAAVLVASRGALPPRLGTYAGLVLAVLAALIAAPLAAVLLAWLLRRLLRRAPGVTLRLAGDNLLRQPGRTGMVVTAMAASIALLLQTGGLIRSNENAVRDWVDRSIAGDLFVTSGGPLSASGRTLPLGEPSAARLCEELPGARVVSMRFRYLDWRHEGRAVRVLLLALDAEEYDAVNRHRRSPLPDAALYARLKEPGAALVSENFAALYGVRAGDRLSLPGSDNQVTVTVLGSVADYSCGRGTVIVDRVQFREPFDAGLIDVLDVYLPEGADAGAARERVRQLPWAAEQSLCILTREELRGHVLGMVSRLYGLAYVQEVVVGAVALLGVVTALLLSVLQRRREIGTLRALGATRGQVIRLVLAEAGLLAVLGLVAGVLAGLPLEWFTVRVLLLEESGFLCPVCVPWLSAAVVAALALLGSVLAGVGPALHAARSGVIEMIAWE